MAPTEETAQKAARLLVRDFHASEGKPPMVARRWARDAIRGLTLLDAKPAPLQFSMDDYRDVTRAMATQALEWLQTQAVPAPPKARVAATRAALAALWADDRKRKRQSPTALLGASVLSTWPLAEHLRVAALLFEVGLLRSKSEPDGPLWYSKARQSLRFHLPTALLLFPDLRQEEASSAPPAALPRRRW